MKVQFYGKIQIDEDQWADLNTENTIFEIPDEETPFGFFEKMMPIGTHFLVSYKEIKE